MDTSSKDRLRQAAGSLIEVAFPRRCAGCGLRGYWVCEECLEATRLFTEPRCPTCSMPTGSEPCTCDELPDRIDRLWIAGPYEGWLRSAIHSFKFNGETARVSHLAGLLTQACAEMGTDSALASVPLHPKRKRQRGYDQTAMLADRVANTTGLSRFTGLKKIRHTPHQVGLSAAERTLNLLDAFSVLPGIQVPDRVILVDDVATTGATLTESAIALRKAGVCWVGAVVIAHGL